MYFQQATSSWLIDPRVVLLPFRGTFIGWRDGLTWRDPTKFSKWKWGGPAPCTPICCRLARWKAAAKYLGFWRISDWTWTSYLPLSQKRTTATVEEVFSTDLVLSLYSAPGGLCPAGLGSSYWTYLRKFNEKSQGWFRGCKISLWQKTERTLLFSLGNRSLRGILLMYVNTWEGLCEEKAARLFAMGLRGRTGDNGNTRFCLSIRKLLFAVKVSELEVSDRGCRVSIFNHTKKLPTHDPGQQGLGVPTWQHWHTSQDPLQH